MPAVIRESKRIRRPFSAKNAKGAKKRQEDSYKFIFLALLAVLAFLALKLVGLSSICRALSNTSRSIAGVSFPVNVFCWLG